MSFLINFILILENVAISYYATCIDVTSILVLFGLIISFKDVLIVIKKYRKNHVSKDPPKF